jgi:hypothetical protein
MPPCGRSRGEESNDGVLGSNSIMMHRDWPWPVLRADDPVSKILKFYKGWFEPNSLERYRGPERKKRKNVLNDN